MSNFSKISIFFTLVFYFPLPNQAQDLASITIDTYHFSQNSNHIDTTNKKKEIFSGYIATSGLVSSNKQVPLWMRSMQNGGIPLGGLSNSVFSGFYKNYFSNSQEKIFDWGAGFNIRANAGQEIEFYLIEAYAKARVGIFQLSAGRTKDFVGMVDSTLSTGAFSMSGNALGLPKIELSTPHFWKIPFTKGLLAFKGSIAHGWMGKRISHYTNYGGDQKYTTYLHQKTLYGRFGKPFWKIRLYGGLNHGAMWGSEQKMFENFGLTEWETYQYVFTGKTYSNWSGSRVPGSKIGNHLGSIDQGMELRLKSISIFAYHQFYYEAGALAKLANAKDGTWGLSLKNTNQSNKSINWHKILLEFIYSKSQGGEIDGPVRNSPFEDYYHNSYYIEGWTNESENIGNILFTSKKYINEELPSPNKFIVNNRLISFHSGFEFSYSAWHFISKLTFSQNFGNYMNSPAHRGLGPTIVYHDPPYFGQVNQFNGYLEAMRPLKNGWELNMAFAIDHGELLYNSVGGEVKVVKRW